MRRATINEHHEIIPIGEMSPGLNKTDANKHLWRVGETTVGHRRVSTVFLGLDHGWNGVPMWFETMIFSEFANDRLNEWCERYTTWEQAKAGHDAVARRLQKT